eukprot:s1770_g15.t1
MDPVAGAGIFAGINLIMLAAGCYSAAAATILDQDLRRAQRSFAMESPEAHAAWCLSAQPRPPRPRSSSSSTLRDSQRIFQPQEQKELARWRRAVLTMPPDPLRRQESLMEMLEHAPRRQIFSV